MIEWSKKSAKSNDVIKSGKDKIRLTAMTLNPNQSTVNRNSFQ